MELSGYDRQRLCGELDVDPHAFAAWEPTLQRRRHTDVYLLGRARMSAAFVPLLVSGGVQNLYISPHTREQAQVTNAADLGGVLTRTDLGFELMSALSRLAGELDAQAKVYRVSLPDAQLHAQGIAVFCGSVREFEHFSVQERGWSMPLLPVVLGERTLTVGPWITPHSAPCIQCVISTHAYPDGDLMAAQRLSHLRTRSVVESLAAALGVATIFTAIDSHGSLDTDGMWWQVSLLDGQMHSGTLSPHPSCGCWLQYAYTGEH